MINQFSGNAAVPPPPPSANSQPVSEEKTARLNEVLSEYDAENLSDADAENIVSQIKELGIEPGAGLAKVMSDAGFNAREIGEQAGVAPAKGSKNRPPPPPPSGASNGTTGTINTEAMIALELLSESSDTNTTNWADISQSMAEQGFDMSQPLMDIRA